jgi:transglutaminase-like putative cysteine protease
VRRILLLPGLALAALGAALSSGAAVTRGGPGETMGTTKRTFRFSYAVKVRDIPAGARRVSIWVPVPRTDRHQQVRHLDVKSPVPYRMQREPRYGNTILHLEADAPLPGAIDLQFEALVERRSYSVLADRAQAEAGDPSPRDLQADALVPVDGRIAALAAEVTRNASTPLAKARAIYDHVTGTMRYDKSGDGWGRGDAIWACDAKRGNCTDFHSLVIALARAAGIPARFVIGFPLPDDRTAGDVPGYHCWAEMWIEGTGWLPVDSSEASKHPEKRDAYFGGLDANRIEFTRGRDLELVPEASETLNYFVYPHVEVDGKPFGGVDRRFSFTDVNG